MKKLGLAILCVLFCSEICLASGKIYLRANSFDRDSPDDAKGKYSLGLYVSEPLMSDNHLSFISFVGGALNGNWLRSDQQFQSSCNNLVYGVGIDTLIYSNRAENRESVYYATLGYKLWN